jgi:heme/copper-type cytochrome/quinol oxidase subunit 2
MKLTQRLIIGMTALSIAATPIAALALDIPQPPGQELPQIDSLSEAGANIAAIVGWVIAVFWVVVVLFAVLAAFNYLTAQGDPEKVGKAKQMVVYTLIAAAVALLGTGIRSIVVNILTAQ